MQARPMANRVSVHAITAVAAAAAKLSVRQMRTWWSPANTEARPAMHAIKTTGMKMGVTTLPMGKLLVMPWLASRLRFKIEPARQAAMKYRQKLRIMSGRTIPLLIPNAMATNLQFPEASHEC